MIEPSSISQRPADLGGEEEQSEERRAAKRLCLPAESLNNSILQQLMDSCSSFLGLHPPSSLTSLYNAVE